MTVLAELLALQAIDTEIAQLEHKSAHLTEADAVRAAEQRVAATTEARRKLDDEARSLAATVDANERSVGELRRQVDRLNGQLRTVIAPREAEALQHEIRILTDKMSVLDDESLVAIERSEALDAETSRTASDETAQHAALTEALGKLDIARTEVDALLADARERRDAVAGAVDHAWVEQYERRKRDHGGIAVARLVRSTCGGCHLDLSPTEVEAVKRQADDARECPNCARWLVV